MTPEPQLLRRPVRPTGVERTFGQDEIIVSKTDLKGRITYANRVFLQVAGYTEREVLGAPHSLIRHPDMPRSVFQLLWDTIQGGREVFAYVVNLAKNGDHYWVLAHVTPTFDDAGKIVGYHSMRRLPARRLKRRAAYTQRCAQRSAVTPIAPKALPLRRACCRQSSQPQG